MYSSRGLCFIRYLTPILLYLHNVYGYNMDVRSPIIKTGMRGTYFGFSVDIHKEGNDNMIIVGAPRGDSLPGVNKTGAVYKCSVAPPYTSTSNCEALRLENSPGTKKDKSHQWLGATVKSSGPNGVVMSCAPFYKILVNQYIEISGKCFLQTDNFANKEMVVLCEPQKGGKIGFVHGTSCLAGLSGDLTEEGRYVIGAPGSYAAQGSVYTGTSPSSFQLPDERDWRTGFDGSIQGYSVAYGKFNAHEELNYVAGAPRAKNLLGQVFIYVAGTSKLDEILEISGKQIGSNFGHSVAVSDLNGDNRDDLIIGAPSYWNRETQQIAVGQLHVYYQNKEHKLPSDGKTDITGKVTNGRFGFAIAPLGDINDDGVNDLAVAAPYDEDGAVFIYHGGHVKINTEPTQVLRPRSFGETFNNFGFTLAGGRDADSNTYPDLLVGDYSSDKVLLVRTRPIIRPSFRISFDRERVNKSNGEISVLNKTLAGFNVTLCMGYGGRGTPSSYNFSIQLKMDADKQNPRAFFYVENQQQREVLFPEKTIQRDSLWCEEYTAVLRDTFADKQTAIAVQISGRPVEKEDNLPEGEIAPVVDSSRQSLKEQIPIKFDCVNVGCTTNLVVNAASDTDILYMGGSSILTLTITVQNEAEEAFAAKLYASVHDSLRYAYLTAIESDLVIRCDESDMPTGLVICDIGNPLPRETRLKFNLTFEIPAAPGHTETLMLHLHVNSTTAEEEGEQSDNQREVSIKLEPKIEVILHSSTNLPQLVYNETTIKSDDINSTKEAGEEIIHTYWVENKGPGTIQNATLTVSWPMKTAEEEEEEYLLYLFENLTLSNGVKCDVIGTEINPKGLKIPTLSSDSTGGRNEGIDTSESDRRSRRKRSAETPDNVAESEEELPIPLAQTATGSINEANCSRNYKGCITIQCPITDVTKDSENIVLTIRSRLWAPTLPKDNILSWDIVSSAVLTIHSLPYVVQPEEGLIHTAMLTVSAIPETVKQKQTAPPWSIIISIIVGLLLLLLIILLLWKLGFFKRKKFDKTLIQEGKHGANELEEVKEAE